MVNRFGFLAYITQKFNTLNLELQGSDNCVVNIIAEIKALKSKLLLCKIKTSLTNSLNMEKSIKGNKSDSKLHSGHLEYLSNIFNERFTQLHQIRTAMMFCYVHSILRASVSLEKLYQLYLRSLKG
jgi:hypothetical protein